MEPLKVVAHLGSNLVAFDDYSPSLDGILEYQILDLAGRIVPNPTDKDVEENRPLVWEEMPIARGEIAGDWYWQCSSPCYLYYRESTTHFAKRWTPGTDTPSPDWGKRKPKFNTTQGAEKSFRLPLFVRTAPVITWYVVGDRSYLQSLLNGVTGIGKKRSFGNGLVHRWEVLEHGEDWHLWRQNELMRPIPVSWVDRPTSFAIRRWAFRPPGHLISNATQCAMPVTTAQYRDIAMAC